MKTNKRKILIIMLVGVLINTVAFGIELTEEFHTNDYFSIKLPFSWVQIPKKTLDEQSEKLHKLAPDMEIQYYDYGFHLLADQFAYSFSGLQGLSYPYILINVIRSGRIPKAELRKFKYIESDLEEYGKKSSIISDLKFNEFIYDAKDHVLWSYYFTNIKKDAPVSNKGQVVRALMAMKLTEEGYILVNCYCEDKDFHEYGALFEKIVKNIDVDKTIEYKPRVMDFISFKWLGIDWLKVLLFAVLGAFIGILWGAMKKGRKIFKS